MDGTADAVYGAPLVVQNTQTQFGDSDSGQADLANGSELDAAFGFISNEALYLVLAGNLESNANQLDIFIDSKPGGQNRVLGGHASAALNTMGDDGSGNGLRFESDFEADYLVSLSGLFNPTYALNAQYAEMLTGGGGAAFFLGSTAALSDGTLAGGTNPDSIRVTIDNRNVGGVTAGSGIDSGVDVRTGVELAIPLAAIGNPAGPVRVCALVASSDHFFVSNQVLAGLGGGGNLGFSRFVNFAARGGDQSFLVNRAADCNSNGAPDALDIASGTSADCQPNGVPDECDGGCADTGLKFVDPNPAQRQGAAVTTNVNRLASGGRVVEGLAADGATPVLIRFAESAAGSVEIRVEDEAGSTVSAHVGVLSDARGQVAAANPITLQLTQVNASWLAFAVLTSPVDFVRNAADESLGQQSPRRLVVHATFTPAGGGAAQNIERNMWLVRPPVCLIHGVWSEGAMWRWPLYAPGDTRFVVWSQDYQSTNASHFAVNVVKARIGVASAVRRLRARHYAVTRADVVGHSMGGILSRLYIASPNYVRNDNFGLGDVHKLISLDSPHKGSELANLLDALNLTAPAGAVSEWVADQARSAGFCTDCGAIDDLRIDSVPIINLPAAAVPAHAIAGTGGSDLIANGAVATLPHHIRLFFMALDLLGWPPSRIFAELGVPQHDLIVGFESQQGGLTGPRLSFVGQQWGYSILGSIHFGVPEFLDPFNAVGVPVNAAVGDVAIGLLNAKTSSTSFAAGGFPAAPFLRPSPIYHDEIPALRVASGGLAITSPAPGTVVAAGSQISVTVEASGGFVPEAVLIATPGDGVLSTNGQFTVQVEVPVDASGPMPIRAMARNSADEFAVAADVVVQVTFTATLTGIHIIPDEATLFSYAPTAALRVMGEYDDNVDRNLTASGTSYVSSNGAIVEVSSNGALSAMGLGTTRVLVTHGSYQAQVAVTVESLFADSDSDGDVDLGDYQEFSNCLSGPHDAAGFVMPTVECRDAFDGNLDSDIDLEDGAAFQRAFTG